MIYGPTGTGKTTLIQQLMLATIGVRAPDFLGLPVAARKRWLYVAADRPAQIKRSLRRMVCEADRSLLDERLVFHDGSLDFDIGQEPERLLALALDANADTVVMDSLKDTAVGLEKSDVGQAVNRAHQLLVSNGIEVVINHHPRKAQVGNSKPKAIDDVFGSRFIVDGCGSVLLLWGAPGDSVVELSHLKQPRDSVGPWTLVHNHEAGVTTVQEQLDAYAVIMASNGISAEGIAKRLFKAESPNKNQIENARRKAKSVVKRGLAWEEPGEQGGRDGGRPALFFKLDSVHGASTPQGGVDSESVHAPRKSRTAHDQPAASTFGGPPDSESVHESVHAVHETTVHETAPLFREGGRDRQLAWEEAVV